MKSGDHETEKYVKDPGVEACIRAAFKMEMRAVDRARKDGNGDAELYFRGRRDALESALDILTNPELRIKTYIPLIETDAKALNNKGK